MGRPRWITYTCIYSVLLVTLGAFYLSWESFHPPVTQVLGTHPKHPLTQRKLLQLATEVSNQFLDVDTELQFSHRCKDCAVVVSSGQLLDREAGKEIDNASCVVRMNDAPTLGHSTDVGSKTTLRVVCFQSLPLMKESLLIGHGKTDMVAVWGADNPRRRGKASYMMKQVTTSMASSPVQFFSMNHRGEDVVARMYEDELGIDRVRTHTWVSTGVFTMLLAVQMCDSITVYGLSDEDYCRLNPDSVVPYHYYGRSMLECEMYRRHQAELKTGSHRFISEKSMFRHWAAMLDIQFKHPSWDLARPTPGEDK